MAKEKTEEFTMDLEIYQPEVNSGKVTVNGNFETLQKQIISLVDKYKGTELTEDNINYVIALKSNFVSLRTSIEEKRKSYNDIYITPMKKYVDGMCKDLIAKVQEGEFALKQQLDEYDQKRKDELTVILSEYVADSVAKHGLREEFANQIQLIDKYYNKTQKEEDSADDIERQAYELEKAQKEYDNGVALIMAECEESGMFAETYIRELQYKSAMEIILEIKQDKKTRTEMEKKEEKGETVVIGEKQTFNDLDEIIESNAKVRTRRLELTYKESQAETVKKLFSSLQSMGVTYRFI